MNNCKAAILITCHRILVKGKKHYATPNINTIIELLIARHRTQIKRRWLFQCLHDIEKLGYISRHKRFVKNDQGLWEQIPSMISITLKGARWLYSKGIEGAAALVKKILNWCHRDDKRFPDQKIIKPWTVEGIERNKIHLGELLKSLG